MIKPVDSLVQIIVSVFLLFSLAYVVNAEETEGVIITSEDESIALEMTSLWTNHEGSIGGSCPGDDCYISRNPYVVFDFVPGIPDLDYAEALVDSGTIGKPLGIGVWASYDKKDQYIGSLQTRFLFPNDQGDRWNLLVQNSVGTLFIALLDRGEGDDSNKKSFEFLSEVAIAFEKDLELQNKLSEKYSKTSAPKIHEKPYVPENLEEAISYLKKNLSEEDLDKIKEDTVMLHHGIGTGLRNSWGLWSGSPLTKWFNEIGVFHPDDMSGIILENLQKDLLGEPLNLDEQIEEIKRRQVEAEEYARKEAIKEKERGKFRESAGLGWQWKNTEALTAELPKEPDWHDIWGLYPYGDGFLVLSKAWRKSFKRVWHDGIYYLGAADSNLQPVELDRCGIIHDVLVFGAEAKWLCENYQQKLFLVTTSPGREAVKKELKIDAEEKWFRLGKGEKGLLLLTPDTVYRYRGKGFKKIYQSSEPTRAFPRFDSDLKSDDELEYFFPHRGKAPVEYKGKLYFVVESSGNQSYLYRLDLKSKKGKLENFDDYFVRKYVGAYAYQVSDIIIDNENNMWVASPDNGNLVRMNSQGRFKIASLFSFVEPLVSLDNLRSKRKGMPRFPTGAMVYSGDDFFHAGKNGIVKVKNGEITPVVYFVLPDNVRHNTYEYDIKPQCLGLFKDGSFVIGDQYNGLYVLNYLGESYRFRVPAVEQTNIEIDRL